MPAGLKKYLDKKDDSKDKKESAEKEDDKKSEVKEEDKKEDEKVKEEKEKDIDVKEHVDALVAGDDSKKLQSLKMS